MATPKKKAPVAKKKAAPKTAKVAKKAAPKKTAPKKAATSSKGAASSSADASKQIDQRIASLGDWRGKTMTKLRALIKQAVPDVVEAWKWRGVPVWYSTDGGILCTGESYPTYVKTTFMKGAALADPKKLFNASLDGGTRRAIDFHETSKIDEAAFKALVKGAAALNAGRKG